ncbi:5-oxoprolinase subunit PxpA [Arenibacter sp. 6A1]|uniref:5-oxoprolinase subunit PxpA n=1 Tax=Arenibacter sp. 6A1 TaxID=2720391 RepID=UPI00293BE4C9|nr:5-oxoprolinase subunit PxpA [Arenibacter sp. 6A1]
MEYSIDINCDIGEGMENEEILLPLISSCNIACGGHAGDLKTMRRVALLAKQHRVLVGAHPSYPDKERFGRVSMTMGTAELKQSIGTQLEDFCHILKEEGIPLNHIKPHGALYNDLVKDLALVKVFLEILAPYKKGIYLYVPYNSVIAKEALEKGFKIKYEAFADRNYNSDLTLVPRKDPQAVINDPKAVLRHLMAMVKDQAVTTLSGEERTIIAETFCIHGDSERVSEILTYLSVELPKNLIYIK